MIELYFNDANLLPENREEEQYAEAALNNVLTGKTANTGMCILPCFYDAPLHKGLLYNLDDGTTLRMGLPPSPLSAAWAVSGKDAAVASATAPMAPNIVRRCMMNPFLQKSSSLS